MTFASIFVNYSLHGMISLVQCSLCLSRRKYQKHGKFRLNNIMQFDSCSFHSNQIQPFKVFRKYLHYIAAQLSVYNFNVLSTKHLCTFQCSTKGPVFGNVSGNNQDPRMQIGATGASTYNSPKTSTTNTNSNSDTNINPKTKCCKFTIFALGAATENQTRIQHSLGKHWLIVPRIQEVKESHLY